MKAGELRLKDAAELMRTSYSYARVVVPDHKQIRPGTLRHILTEAGLTVEQLLELR